jgi:hypothetical protein
MSNQCNLKRPEFLEKLATVVVFFCLNVQNLSYFTEAIKLKLNELAKEINQKMESRRQAMRNVYKIIFNLEEVSKEKMKDPSPKEKKILAKYEDVFSKSVYDNFSEICSFYNTF